MNRNDYAERLLNHVQGFFGGHRLSIREFDDGLTKERVPGFSVIEVEPGPKTQLWTYVSVGAALAHERPLEFVCVNLVPSERFVQLLAMTAYYHATETLGRGHMFPLGQPWVPESTLEYAVVSLPYLFGPSLEVFNYDSLRVPLFWLLPITEQERVFGKTYGLEALEQRFDAAALEYWNVSRASVV